MVTLLLLCYIVCALRKTNSNSKQYGVGIVKYQGSWRFGVLLY